MPPPAPLGPVAELPVIVLFVTFIGPLWTLKMPPPALAVLPLIVLLVTLTVPVPLLKMPPPEGEAVLLLRVLLLMLTAAVLLLRIPPPEEPPGTCPLEIVNPEKLTTPGLAVTLNTRLLLFPLIVSRFA